MNNIFLLTVIITILKNLSDCSAQQSTGFTNFLSLSMQNYPSWLQSNKLDPSPLIPEPVTISDSNEGLINIFGEITNQILNDHSQLKNHAIYVDGNLLRGYMRIQFFLQEHSISGEYFVNGTVLSSIPVTGAGNFNGAASTENHSEVVLQIENFGVSPEGYINISRGYIYSSIQLAFEPLAFNGLAAGGFEKEVGQFIQNRYELELRQKIIPLHLYLQRYFEELFERTTVADIIGTTLAPTTTEGISTISTEISSPGTEIPCKAIKENILNENILERNVTFRVSDMESRL